MSFDSATFWRANRADASRAQSLVDRCDALASMSGTEDESELATTELESALTRLWLRIQLAADQFNARGLGQELRMGWRKFREEPASLKYSAFVGLLYSPALAFISNALDALSVAIPELEGDDFRRTAERDKLEQILRATASMLHSRKIKPSSEADVRREMYLSLSVYFPDTVRDPFVPHPIRASKPDFGIPSLRAAIEYKFVDSEGEFKGSTQQPRPV